MQASEFSLEQYLSRIQFTGAVRPNLHCLKAVMQRHIQSIPFENIDVQLGRAISMDANDIFAKLVVAGRGGYCYEHNGLFAQYLCKLGLSYQLVACRPMFYPDYRPRTHLALIVDVDDGQWLCDLGFGALGINEPLNINELNHAQCQGSDTFRLIKSENDYRILQAKEAGDWVSQYGFNLSEFEWVDFVPANYFNFSHPESFFVKNLIVLIKTITGRHALLGRRLKTVENGKVQERELSDQDLPHILKEIFNVPNTTIHELMSTLYANA